MYYVKYDDFVQISNISHVCYCPLHRILLDLMTITCCGRRSNVADYRSLFSPLLLLSVGPLCSCTPCSVLSSCTCLITVFAGSGQC